MNSKLLTGLLKVAPLGITAFTLVLSLHGLHVINTPSGDPLGPGGPNMHMVSGGDPLGPGGPN